MRNKSKKLTWKNILASVGIVPLKFIIAVGLKAAAERQLRSQTNDPALLTAQPAFNVGQSVKLG